MSISILNCDFRYFASLVLFAFAPGLSWAYPEFIAYGYGSCLTCHYNGQGGGPLNDYGRALWSAEIASRAFFSASDEKLAESSGFLGSVPLPFWLRPHAKYRGMELKQNPNGTGSAPEKYYHMQMDAGATFSSESGKIVASITMGRVVKPEDYFTGRESAFSRILAREYFLRWQASETWWVYAGLLEKVYGLRNINHAALQRRYQGFNPYNNSLDGISHSQGVIVQRVTEKWELAVNYFTGNPNDERRFKQKGFSASGEYEIGDKKRIGASVATESSDVLQKKMASIHYRQGVLTNSSLMIEWGLIQDRLASTGKHSSGSYGFLETMVHLTRGYNLVTSVEHYNKTFEPSEPDNWRWNVGMLMFPLPRLELRVDAQIDRYVSTQNSQADRWQLMGQVHVSL